MENKVFYIKNSVPLEEAEEFVIGDEYFNLKGEGFRYAGNEVFDKTKETPLLYGAPGATLPELTRKEALKLFWILSKNLE